MLVMSFVSAQMLSLHFNFLLFKNLRLQKHWILKKCVQGLKNIWGEIVNSAMPTQNIVSEGENSLINNDELIKPLAALPTSTLKSLVSSLKESNGFINRDTFNCKKSYATTTRLCMWTFMREWAIGWSGLRL